MRLGLGTSYVQSGLVAVHLTKVLVNKLGVFGGQLSRRSVCMTVSCPRG